MLELLPVRFVQRDNIQMRTLHHAVIALQENTLLQGLESAVFVQQVNIQVQNQHHVIPVLLDLILFKDLPHVLFVQAELLQQ